MLRMMHKYLACIGGISLLAAIVSAQTALGPQVRVRFPDPGKQRVAAQYMFRKTDGSYLQMGGAGGQISGSLMIPMLADQPTDRVKARVWTLGCAVKAFDIALAGADVEVQFVCDPEKTVPFRGRVAGPPGSSAIAAQYSSKCTSIWIEQRENGPCALPIFAATAKLESDGSFAIDLPDFKDDPILSSDSSAVFKFLVRMADGNWRMVNPEGSKDPSIAVASSYPDDVTFVVPANSN
jgi:hypothetical protein